MQGADGDRRRPVAQRRATRRALMAGAASVGGGLIGAAGLLQFGGVGRAIAGSLAAHAAGARRASVGAAVCAGPDAGTGLLLPCDERFLAPGGIGQANPPYAGQNLPSDGPLLDLRAPERSFVSEQGLLSARVTVRSGTPDAPLLFGSAPYRLITYNGASRLGSTVAGYNGIFPGPTLVAAPGDRVELTLVDERIPAAIQQASPDAFDPTWAGADPSNIHFHGVLTSPVGPGDNVFRVMEPGNTYRVAFALPPNHDRGTNWYHPHLHTTTTEQVNGGLAGLFEVGDPTDAPGLAAYAGLPQRRLVLTATSIAPSAAHPGLYELGPYLAGPSPVVANPNPSANGAPLPYHPAFTVNGQINPTITMQPGATELWTFVNVNPYGSFNLGLYRLAGDGRIDPTAPLFGSVLLAQDGNDQGVSIAGAFATNYDVLARPFLGPGERLLFAITAPAAPGRYFLVNVRDQAFTGQMPNLPAMLTFEPPPAETPSIILATIDVGGEPVRATFPAPTPTRQATDLLAQTPDVVRDQVTFDFDERTMTGRVDFGNFPHVPMAQGYSRDVEQWVVATYSQVSHPFHIHQGQFVVEQIEYFADQALTEPRTDLPENPVVNRVPRMMDTFAFPARSKVTLRLRASDFPGKFVFHCHLLLHEDSGMMAAVRITLPRAENLVAVGSPLGAPASVSLTTAADGRSAGTWSPFAGSAGVSAAAGDLLGDRVARIVTAPRSGPATLRVHDRTGKVLASAEPFPGADGASVALGDVDGDARDEILVAPGPGADPSVLMFRASVANGKWALEPIGTLPVLDGAYRTAGVRVASADVDGDNWDDIVVAGGPGAPNRIQVYSGQALSLGKSAAAALIADTADADAGTTGLNIVADVFAGGFLTYPPASSADANPVASPPYQAMVAAAPAAPGPDAVVTMYRLLGGGSHAGHGAGPAAPEPTRLAPIAQFAPFGADAAPTGGLMLASALTTALDPSNPSVGVVAATGVDRQTITLFDRSGELTTREWGARTEPSARRVSSNATVDREREQA